MVYSRDPTSSNIPSYQTPYDIPSIECHALYSPTHLHLPWITRSRCRHAYNSHYNPQASQHRRPFHGNGRMSKMSSTLCTKYSHHHGLPQLWRAAFYSPFAHTLPETPRPWASPSSTENVCTCCTTVSATFRLPVSSRNWENRGRLARTKGHTWRAQLYHGWPGLERDSGAWR